MFIGFRRGMVDIFLDKIFRMLGFFGNLGFINVDEELVI